MASNRHEILFDADTLIRRLTEVNTPDAIMLIGKLCCMKQVKRPALNLVKELFFEAKDLLQRQLERERVEIDQKIKDTVRLISVEGRRV